MRRFLFCAEDDVFVDDPDYGRAMMMRMVTVMRGGDDHIDDHVAAAAAAAAAAAPFSPPIIEVKLDATFFVLRGG